ncbi:hypothetical protein PROFUN_12820 [Planoprotostelium fungivorum]|uniref:Phosphatidylinositol-specific phospholipase C X domain-containing protein n=1 Tax=Planoprotostelium fungivorum TaxID=1890364 RepID=A0A2P6N6R1_9EUKA|nr:hypothetical protein PROFUN_12820 [Planoprotostelium fungivorum]
MIFDRQDQNQTTCHTCDSEQTNINAPLSLQAQPPLWRGMAGNRLTLSRLTIASKFVEGKVYRFLYQKIICMRIKSRTYQENWSSFQIPLTSARNAWGWIYLETDTEPKMRFCACIAYPKALLSNRRQGPSIAGLSLRHPWQEEPRGDITNVFGPNGILQDSVEISVAADQIKFILTSEHISKARIDYRRWLQDLTLSQEGSWLLDAPITHVRFPGTHNSATYGEGFGLFRKNWCCQNMNIYQQLSCGIRYFDIRMAPDPSRASFYPCHGVKHYTGDKLAQSRNQLNMDDIICQILRFIEGEGSKELIIIEANLEYARRGKEQQAEEFWMQWMILEKYLLPYTTKIPTLSQVREQNRCVLLWGNHNDSAEFLSKNEQDTRALQLFQTYVWPADDDPTTFLKGSEWNGKVWQSGDLDEVVSAVRTRHFTDESLSREYFWRAQLQLTPSFFHTEFLTKKATFSPAKLARKTNPRVAVILDDKDWKDNMSIVSVDFPTTDIIYQVVKANLHKMRGEGRFRSPEEDVNISEASASSIPDTCIVEEDAILDDIVLERSRTMSVVKISHEFVRRYSVAH